MNFAPQDSIVVCLIASHIAALAAGIAIGHAARRMRDPARHFDNLERKDPT